MYRSMRVLVLFTTVISVTTIVLSNGKIDRKCIIEAEGAENAISVANCYVACIMREAKVVTTEGYLNVNSIIKKLPSDLENYHGTIEGLKICGNRMEEDFCERVFKIGVCINEKSVILDKLKKKSNFRKLFDYVLDRMKA